MNRREENVEIFSDSTKLMTENPRLKQSIKSSIANQRIYLEDEAVRLPESKGLSCTISVSTKRSFEAASAYAKAGKKVAVLNFASSTKPGGGVLNGSTAQEECLCRCSTLYPCLNTNMMWQQFYGPHRQLQNALYNDDCLYTPEVTVFKSDEAFPRRMEENDWYQVDVITCAAPNLKKNPSGMMNPSSGKTVTIGNDSLYNLHVKRIEKIFGVAAANGAEVLVLGAFGCGAFYNPPRIVAKAFKHVQEKYASYFETIEYAIYCRESETDNYDAFREIMGKTK